LRTQQVLAHESGVAQTADPLGGSHYVESLTDQIEQRSRVLLEEIEERGGAAAAVEGGYFQDAIARSAYEHQRMVEREERVVVGVNRHVDEERPPVIPAPDYRGLAERQWASVAATRQRRDAGGCATALATLRTAAQSADGRLMEPIIAAVKARATVGEISDTLRGVWGTFHAGG
jgi:methylmalonyl-CoA mutase N-terminal domain/subunit